MDVLPNMCLDRCKNTIFQDKNRLRHSLPTSSFTHHKYTYNIRYFVCTHKYVCTRVCVCLCRCRCACVCVRRYVCVGVLMNVLIHTLTHAHIHKQTHTHAYAHKHTHVSTISFEIVDNFFVMLGRLIL